MSLLIKRAKGGNLNERITKRGIYEQLLPSTYGKSKKVRTKSKKAEIEKMKKENEKRKKLNPFL